MFDLGWPELFVIASVALVIIGPKDLPRVMRTVGRYMGKAKAMTREFRRHVDDMMRESELDEVRQQIQQAASTDPGAYVENSIDPNKEIKEAFEFGGEELVNVDLDKRPAPDSREVEAIEKPQPEAPPDSKDPER